MIPHDCQLESHRIVSKGPSLNLVLLIRLGSSVSSQSGSPTTTSILIRAVLFRVS